jgi:L-aminoadipate-semialdehyde dehydrogenase
MHIGITAQSHANRVLDKLGLEAVNSGACTGADGWCAPKDGAPIISINPTTGHELAAVLPADDRAYDTVVTAATQAFERWRDTPAPVRGQVVRDLADALRELKEPLGELVTLEMGKIRAEGLGEVQEMIDICDLAVGQSRQLYGKSMPSERPDHRLVEQYHPLGVVGVISAFNFPVAVWAWNAALAAVCGDPVVWKPSSKTPLTAVAVQRICNRVTADHGLDGLFNLLIGPGRVVGERLAQDHRVKLLSFTGSTRRGRHAGEVVARRLGRSLLELGGNNAVVVTQHANLDLAVPAIVFGAVGTAGQRCTSTRRVIVHRDVAPDLTRRLVHAYDQVRVGDPMVPSTLLGPLVDSDAVQDMSAALDAAHQQGGVVLSGGKPLPQQGANFAEPTLVHMPAQSDIVRQETFAPILYLLEYDTLDEAIALHNGVPQGLSSAIFTEDLRESEAFLAAAGSDCGIANVNLGTSGAEIGGAFGGEKDTGGGREAGSDAWRAYMRRQTNTVNRGTDLPLAQGIRFDL